MATLVEIRLKACYDSVKLMRVAGSLQTMADVQCATVVMGTPLNINTLIADGFSEDPLCRARPNDLIIAIVAGIVPPTERGRYGITGDATDARSCVAHEP
jgi:hypothetical protein